MQATFSCPIDQGLCPSLALPDPLLPPYPDPCGPVPPSLCHTLLAWLENQKTWSPIHKLERQGLPGPLSLPSFTKLITPPFPPPLSLSPFAIPITLMYQFDLFLNWETRCAKLEMNNTATSVSFLMKLEQERPGSLTLWRKQLFVHNWFLSPRGLHTGIM